MEIAIIETPIHFHLHGKSGVVENNAFGQVGLQLMDEMWKMVKGANAATTGINYWVYLPGGRMFTGVELKPDVPMPAGLEPLQFSLPRYLKHLHIGPYQALPAKWQALMAELRARGENMGPHGLEIYGHHCVDPAQLETTILIGLQ